MPGAAHRAPPRRDTRAEVIVFPRTGIRALRRLSEIDAGMPPCGDLPIATSADESPA
jgi:hypothetical protein